MGRRLWQGGLESEGSLHSSSSPKGVPRLKSELSGMDHGCECICELIVDLLLYSYKGGRTADDMIKFINEKSGIV